MHRRIEALAISLALLGAGCAGGSKPEPVDPASLRDEVDVPVMAYLSGLGPQDVGRELEGVAMDDPDDDTRFFEGDVYLGRVSALPDPVHVHLLRRDDRDLAVLWVDPDGAPFDLPECDAGKPGFRARLLTGRIYRWRAARPGDGVLVSHCPPDEWLRD